VLAFMSIVVGVAKIMTFFQKILCGDLRSVGATEGSRPIPASTLQ